MGKHLNFVHNDEIWKDHVSREMQSAAYKWPGKWGFLVQEYKQMNADLDGRPPTAQAPKKDNALKLPPIIQPRNSFPVTTGQLIGWKSTDPSYRLENYGRHAAKARGKIGILKIFNWPQQSL